MPEQIMIKKIDALLNKHIEAATACRTVLPTLYTIAMNCIACLQKGGKLFFCGNGGSASDAQHLAAELIGRFYKERAAIPAIALSTDTSVLTCLSNDYSYDIIFERQLEALCTTEDAIILISTSGNSQNLVKAAQFGERHGIYTAAFLGKTGGLLRDQVKDALIVPSSDTPRIQEMHIFLGHTLCELIEEAICTSELAIKEKTSCELL